MELQQYYLQMAQDKKAEEALIEQLTQLESEKQWKLREDKWKKEDQARVNLMKDVYENRAMHVELKKKMKDEKGWLVNNEKQVVESEIAR